MRRRLGIVRRVPDTTLRDALCSIEPEQLARCLHTTVRDAERRKAIHPDALPFGVVSLDGKGTSISACDDWHAQRQSAGQGAPLVGVVRTITATLISSSARPCIDVMPIPARTNEAGRVLRAEDRYLISSLRKDALTATQWQTLVRSRWGVETNHQILDHAFEEDDPWKSLASWRAGDHPWIEQNPRGMLVVAILRRIVYTLLALFRGVTQRSDERRGVPWRRLLEEVYLALLRVTDELLRNAGRSPGGSARTSQARSMPLVVGITDQGCSCTTAACRRQPKTDML